MRLKRSHSRTVRGAVGGRGGAGFQTDPLRRERAATDAGSTLDLAFTGDTPSLRRLHDAGQPLHDTADGEGWTTLMSAVWGGSLDTARFLLERGADPNRVSAGPAGVSAVTLAAAMNRTDLLAALHAHGGRLDRDAPAWGTPLTTAIIHGHHDALRWLIEHGAPLDQLAPIQSPRDNLYLGYRRFAWISPVMAAIARHDMEALRTLLDAGASPSLVEHTAWEETPLYFALANKAYDAARLLIERGADANQFMAGHERVALDAVNDEHDFWAVAREMLDRGADPGLSPTFCYHLLKRPDLTDRDVDRLLAAGMDLNAELDRRSIRHASLDDTPNNAVTLASQLVHDRRQFTRLVERGHIDLQHTIDGYPLGDIIASKAARVGDLNLAADLVERGHGIDVPDEDGQTALFDAVRLANRQARVPVLLLLGADPTIWDRAGKQPIDFARREVLKQYLNGENLRPPAEHQP